MSDTGWVKLVLLDIGVEYDGAEASSPRQLSVKDSGKYVCTEYEIMTTSIKNNYTFRIFYQ